MYVIALIGIGLVLHGFIMLAFAAFRAKAAWGLAVMFVPFAQVFFPIYHWDQARKPFMTFTFGMALWLGTAVVFGQGPLDQYWLDQISLVQAEYSNAQRKAEPLGIEERVAKQKRVLRQPTRVATNTQQRTYQSRIKSIAVKEAVRHVGSYARVTLYDGKVHTGEIVAVQDNKITLQKSSAKNAKGVMTYGLALEKIAKLDVIN
jgi:hypothetical protein